MALDTSFDHPAPVRVIANAMTGYVNRLGAVWVEGQIAQLTRRPQTSTVFLTLRDPLAEVSVSVTCPRSVFDALASPVTEGARVVVFAKFQYYVPRGTLSLVAKQIRPVGVGELLARLEQLRRLLAAEGLFDPVRKRPLPFLPHRVGLVVGRDSAAERDVVDNARRRWPGVQFRVEYAAVQGRESARQVIEALRALDRDPQVGVVIIARGGGALEDLLPFSDEGLIRAVATCTTPVVSAVGHEEDQPLLDLVADLRASTPTDAAKRVVPDVHDETTKISTLRNRSRTLLAHTIRREQQGLVAVRSRPVLAQPRRIFEHLSAATDEWVARGRVSFDHQLARATDDLAHRLARVRALSPLATLERGYAVVQSSAGDVLTSAGQVGTGDRITARLAQGRLSAVVDDVQDGSATDRDMETTGPPHEEP
ncbi:MAG: exodeoxyribonuclease VII large subunit [Propionibacteriales bacterium]|nr:exodeoxyribonuclease VII large subunit [Propionibacteriales bacterium]